MNNEFEKSPEQVVAIEGPDGETIHVPASKITRVQAGGYREDQEIKPRTTIAGRVGVDASDNKQN